MKNDLDELPWNAGQFVRVGNYLEAAGVLNSIRNGISLSSVRRPFETLDISGDAKGRSGSGTVYPVALTSTGKAAAAGN